MVPPWPWSPLAQQSHRLENPSNYHNGTWKQKNTNLARIFRRLSLQSFVINHACTFSFRFYFGRTVDWYSECFDSILNTYNALCSYCNNNESRAKIYEYIIFFFFVSTSQTENTIDLFERCIDSHRRSYIAIYTYCCV